MRIQSEQEAAEKGGEREAEEKENALEIALAAVAENNDHPEEGEEGAGGEEEEAEVSEPVHESGWRECMLEGGAGQWPSAGKIWRLYIVDKKIVSEE